jgi:hypothetical protein
VTSPDNVIRCSGCGSIGAEMKIWRLLLQSTGLITLALSIWGCYFWVTTALSEYQHPFADSKAPFFRAAFWIMTILDAAFLAAFVFAAIKLLQLRPKAALIYTFVLFALIVYAIVPGTLWLLPNGIGASIAAASGVGSTGTGPLIFFPFPFVFPLVSVVLVNFASYRLRRSLQTS